MGKHDNAFLLISSVQFPTCTDADAISVACLDLHYYVTVHEHVQHTSDKKETHMSIALSDLQDDHETIDGETLSVYKHSI